MKFTLIIVMISVQFCALAYSTQRPSSQDDEPSPFLDIASSFLESFSQNQNGGGGSGLDGIAGIASMIGNMVQSSDGGKQQSGAAQMIAGIGSMIAASQGGNGGGGGFDPAMIGNVISMFAAANGGGRDKRSNDGGGSGLDTVLSIASTFLNNYSQNQDDDEVETNEVRQEKRNPHKKNEATDGLMNLLPIVMQTLSSFSGAEMEKTEQKHRDHDHVLPPFLEKIHQGWDHFTQSELSDVLYKKLGLDLVFKGFVGRDGKLNYDKLFDSLQNQSFRRRWISKAISYLADWANFYITNPEIFQRFVHFGIYL